MITTKTAEFAAQHERMMDGDGLAEYCREAILDDDGNECVTENSKCPCCGERRMDWLVWEDGDGQHLYDVLRCATCDTLYYPTEK